MRIQCPRLVGLDGAMHVFRQGNAILFNNVWVGLGRRREGDQAELFPHAFIVLRPPRPSPPPPLPPPRKPSLAARGDRMKQAQAHADSLIAAYRLEQQDAFDASTTGAGESLPPVLFFWRVPSTRACLPSLSSPPFLPPYLVGVS